MMSDSEAPVAQAFAAEQHLDGAEGDVDYGEEEYAEEEEVEEEDSEEENDKREYGIYPCLPVEPGEPDWESGEATTVEEYLRRVRYETRHLPGVVTACVPLPQQEREQQGTGQQTAADAPHGQQQQQQHGSGSGHQGRQRQHHSSRLLASDPVVPACDPRLQPSAAWTRDFLQQFSQLRRRLQREYELTSGQAVASGGGGGSSGLRLLRGPALQDAAAAEELAALQLDLPSALMPELQQLQGLDQLQVRRQLHAALRAATEQGAEVSAEAAATLYALSARIEKPLHAGTCALYRDLLRRCATQRAAAGSAAAGGSSDPRLPHLNILITIAGAYFGQDEGLAGMWEDDEEL